MSFARNSGSLRIAYFWSHVFVDQLLARVLGSVVICTQRNRFNLLLGVVITLQQMSLVKRPDGSVCMYPI
jgi:hypothetical protein